MMRRPLSSSMWHVLGMHEQHIQSTLTCVSIRMRTTYSSTWTLRLFNLSSACPVLALLSRLPPAASRQSPVSASANCHNAPLGRREKDGIPQNEGLPLVSQKRPPQTEFTCVRAYNFIVMVCICRSLR